MKKKKFLATILIASSVFLGTGYAWWTDGLEVEGIVSTGEFKVIGIPANVSEYTKNAREQGDSQDIKSFTYDMQDLFPGRIYEFGAEFKNEGSMPAVVGKVDVTMKEGTDDDTTEQVTIKGSVRIVGGSDELEIITIGTPIAKLATELEKKLNDLKLEPGESLVFEKWEVALPTAKYDENSKENKYEGKDVSFDLEISFKQHNQQ